MQIFIQQKKIASLSDTELLNKYRHEGNRKYFGELYNRYCHLVFLVCLKYLKDRDKSKDAVMDLFESLITKLPSQKIENFKAWLYTVTKNHCLMILRKKSYDTSIDETTDFYFMENESFLHLLEERDVSDELINVKIGQLKKEQKDCIKEFYFNKRSYKDISIKTGFDEKKVKSYIQNGKRNLKNMLEKHLNTVGGF